MVRLREGACARPGGSRITDTIRRIPGIKLGSDWPGVTLESVHDRYVKPVRSGSCFRDGRIDTGAAHRDGKRRDPHVPSRASAAEGSGGAPGTRCRQTSSGSRNRHGSGRRSSAALAVGLTISSWIVRALGPQIELQLGKPAPGGVSTIGLDWLTVTVAVSVCLLVALTLSLVPLFLRQGALADDLRRDSRTATDGRFARWTRSALITVEVAGSIALLVGCGLMVRTALALVNTDLGMNPKGVVRSRIALPLQGYPDDAAFVRFYDRLTTSLASEARATIGMTDWPLFLEPARPLRIELDRTEQVATSAAVTSVNAGYLTTLGIRVLDGRAFSETDRPGSEPVALASETLARRLWPTGRQLASVFAPGSAQRSVSGHGGPSWVSSATSGRRRRMRTGAISTSRLHRCLRGMRRS